LNIIMIIIICVLSLMSVLALISIHGKLIDFNFEITPIGIDNYLSSYTPYKYLLTGTIATCAAYFGLLRLKATIDTNNEKIKQDRFTEWKTIVQVRCSEIELLEPKMTREIIKIRRPIYEYLFARNFRIQNQEELAEVFNANVAELVVFF